MELDLRQLLLIARRRAWIVVLLMVIAGGSAYYQSSRETKVYSTSATLMINSSGRTTSIAPDYNTLLTSQYLADSYAMLVTSTTVLDRAAASLGYDVLPGTVSATAVDRSQFIAIHVTDTDPERAALVANVVVDEFRVYVSDLAADRAKNLRAEIDEKIAAYDQRVAAIDNELATLQAADSASDQQAQQRISDLQQERSSIVQALNNLNTSALTLSAEVMAASPQIDVASQALVPTVPISPKPRQSLLLGLFVGMMLGVGVVALLEFLDNTVKPEQDLEAITGAPMLATISTLGKLQPGASQVFTLAQPNSSATEAMRLLRTNLEFASASAPTEILSVTSPGKAEGKSTITANIGVVMAQGGLRVVIVDADLRRPSQHRIFGIPNDAGLTTLLTHPDQDWHTVATKVALPGLALIPSGPLPPNPADLVSSARFERLLEQIKQEADLVLVDCPPVLVASDALAISARTDGVLLVSQSHATRVDALRQAANAVRRGDIRVIGVVLNRQKGQRGASYYGGYYGKPASQES